MKLADSWTHKTVLTVVGVLVAAVSMEVQAQQDGDLPPNLDRLIERGKEVYFGQPSCVTCHAVGGKGTKRGPDLSDETWIHGSGTYEEIVELVTHGVPLAESDTGREMPFRGWRNSASDADIRAVAAYVWSLSHRQ